jgi:surface polysaccharide O-acyltransferase-like enzyme
LIFVDALRVAIIVFVIIHHAAQAYGPTGGFWPIHDPAQSDWFAPFYTANAAFGMGLMFLIAGYFAATSFERKGARLFLRGRWMRIGIPLLVLVLLVHTPIVYVIVGRPPPADFIRGLYDRGWQPIYLHLWFVAHLLLYSAAFAAWRAVVPRSAPTVTCAPPSHAAIAAFTVALSLITWIVRIRYPVDDIVPLLWIMPAEMAHLPQYVSLFAIGIAAHRGDWFRRMPMRAGLIWLAVGLIAAAGIYVAYGADTWDAFMASGGFNLSSLARSMWETLIAVGLSIGLLVVFRMLFDWPHRLLTAMAAASFGAYILHPAIIVGFQAAIVGAALPAVLKFALVSMAGTLLAFTLAHLSGKVPGLRDVLGTKS